MPNKVFVTILERKIRDFLNTYMFDSKSIFYNESKLIHPGEYGLLREKATIELLKTIIPEKYSISSGFVLSSNGDISTQCDIVIYDKSRNPILNDGVSNFFICESVIAIGEVKSVLNRSQYKKTLLKLSEQKKFGHKVQNKEGFNPKIKELDHIVTFLICQKFDFDYENDHIHNDIYNENNVNHFDRHNLILSVEDGNWIYQFKPYRDFKESPKNKLNSMYQVDTIWPHFYPIIDGVEIKDGLRDVREFDELFHIKDFLHALSSNVKRKNMTYCSMLDYYTDHVIHFK